MTGIIKKEEGSALVLVLFLVALLTVFTTPLLLSTYEGYRNTLKTEQSEQAQQLAEAGINMTLSYFKEKYDPFNPMQTLLDAISYADSVSEQELGFSLGDIEVAIDTGVKEIRSTGRVKDEEITITLSYNPPFPPNLGIFSYPLVFGDVKNISDLESFKDDDGVPITEEQILEYYADFENDFNILVSQLPTGDDIVYSQDWPAGSQLPEGLSSSLELTLSPDNTPDPVAEPEKFIDNNGVLTLLAKTVEIDTGNNYGSSWTIPYPIIATESIKINTDFNNEKDQLTIQGSLTSIGSFEIKDKSTSITIEGNVLSSGDIKIGKEVKDLRIDGFLVSRNGDMVMNQKLEKLNVLGDVMALKKISVGQDSKIINIDGKIASVNDMIDFNQKIEDLLIEEDVIAYKKVNIGQDSSDITINGNLISETDMVDIHSKIDGLTIGKNVVAEKKINIGQDGGNFQFNGNLISQSGEIDLNQKLENVVIEGALVAGNKVNFGQDIQQLTINGSVASLNNSVDFNQKSVDININGDILAKKEITFDKNLEQIRILGRAVSLESVSFSQNISDFSLWGIAAMNEISGNDRSTIVLDLAEAAAAGGSGGSSELSIIGWNIQ
ncbi:hypothetical protein L1765_01635 [Microaerobacter geothermalis]|uniref:hypothetical protein n=1 Tax=Microaerobacter geothermalis TaxID=674972 RepID=UPI001F18EB62|nr:hypothetical protein [Microaerobacter geothermalis]MCF6092694.1 hypothetical protein [Microaerobacter geothermalis]